MAACPAPVVILQQPADIGQLTTDPGDMDNFATVVSTLLLAAHLVTMNVPSAAPLVCIWLNTRRRRGGAAADLVGRQLAHASLWSLLVGMLLGAALVALIWAAGGQGYWDAVRRFPARAYGFALAELAFTAVCLALYAATWQPWRNRPGLHAVVAVLATTNLLYHFPPLMIVLGNLASRPELALESVVTRPVFRGLLLRADVLAQVAHFVVASVAVSGVALMLLANRKHVRHETGEAADRLVAAGARIALAATLAQLAVGLWVLVQLRSEARWALLGDDWLAGGIFFVAVLAAFGLLHSLSAVALGDVRGPAVHRAALLLLAVVLLMTATLSRTRQIEAAPRVARLLVWNHKLHLQDHERTRC